MTNSSPRNELLRALQRLRRDAEQDREEAMTAIETLVRDFVSPEEVSSILSAASMSLPSFRGPAASADSALIKLLWGRCSAEHVGLLASRYEHLSEDGRAAALAALAMLESVEATTVYIELLRTHGWPTQSYPAMMLVEPWSKEWGHVVIAAMLDDSIARLPIDMRYHYLASYAQAGRLSDSILALARDRATIDGQSLLEQLVARERSDDLEWVWDIDYQSLRWMSGWFLHALSYLGDVPAMVRLLRLGEALLDPRLRTSAIDSLVRVGLEPDIAAVKAVVEDAESRGNLFSRLHALGRLDLFPTSHMDQALLAESDMVRWCAFPTELDRAPHHIELMSTIERDLGADGGVFVYYVFRFRTDPPHWAADDGWLGGIAGPFRMVDFPTMASWGETFSSFTPWGEFDADASVSSVEGLRERWLQARRESAV